MRQMFVVIAIAACDSEVEKTPEPPDTSCEFTICQIDTIWATGPTSCERPDFQNVRVIGTCEYGCAYSKLVMGDSRPCARPPPEVYRCERTGSCTAGATDPCAYPLACGGVVSAGTCSCDANGWSCQPGCSDGLCDPADVQAAVTGTWTGTVTTPFTPSSYQATLTIDEDGMWSSPEAAFYYGGNGGTPGAGFFVRAQTETGGVGIVRLFDGSIDGQITGIRVDATRLRFQMIDSWLDCTRTLRFDLVRLK